MINKVLIGYEICQIFKKYKIKHFIDFGSLLGAHREQKIIQNDNDMDIFYFDTEKEIDFIQIFKDLINKYKLSFATYNFGSIFTFYDRNANFKYDLYKCKVKNKRFYPILMEGFSMPLFFIDELEKINLQGFEFNCPRHLDTYLTHRYGHDYMNPKPKYLGDKNWDQLMNNIIPIKENYTAYTSGVYDITHYGHFKLFERISKNFDKCIVGIHNDAEVSSYKRKPKYNLDQRKYMVSSCKYVDFVYENAELVTTEKILKKLNCDYVVCGRDNIEHIKKFYNLSDDKLHVIERTQDISTSDFFNKA